jgi:hypothetical protein
MGAANKKSKPRPVCLTVGSASKAAICAMNVNDRKAVKTMTKPDSTEATEDDKPLYVRFGIGLRDENGDSVDFLVDTRPFEGSVKYERAF